MRKPRDQCIARGQPRVAQRIWPYALLIAVAVAFCGRAIFTGKALAPLHMLYLMSPWKGYARQFPDLSHPQAPMLDPVQQYFPWRLFAVSTVRQGVIPLWNPYAFAGTPFVANLQSAVFYPPNVLFLIMPVALGFTCTAALHLALAGCFMFFFLRVWRISQWPAVVAATAYMLNGYFIAWLEYPAIGLWVAVWLPLVLALYELSLRRRSWPLTAAAGLVIGVQFLGGHLQVAAYVVLAFLLYVVARTIWPARHSYPFQGENEGEGHTAGHRTLTQPLPFDRLRAGSDRERGRWEPPVRAAAALAIGLLLAAGQLLPTMELAARSFRPPIPAAAIPDTALPLTHLIIYFVPKFFGTIADYNYWGNLVGSPGINFLETGGYIGVLPLLLACFAALEWRRSQAAHRALTKYLLALAAISLLLALGTPLYLLLFYAAPGFKQLAGVARAMYLTAFALTALAGVGLERLSTGHAPRPRLVLVVFCVIVFAALAADVYLFLPEINALARTGVEPIASFPRYLLVQVGMLLLLLIASWAAIEARRVMSAGAFGATCFAIVVADLFVAWVNFNPVNDPRMAYPPTPPTTYLRRHAGGARMLAVGTSFLRWVPPNTPIAYSLRDIQGSDSLWWARYFRFLNAAQPGAPTWDWRDLGSPALQMLAVRHIISPRPIEQGDWRLVADEDAFIYRSAKPVARARLFSAWRVAPGARALQSLRSKPGGLLTVPMIETDPGIPQEPGAQAGEATLITDRAQEVSIRCRTPAPRLLVLSDPDYPGWRAEIDGHPVPHMTANYIFRAVAVPAGGAPPAGEHIVTWRYRPTSFRLGLFGGLVGTGIMAAVIALGAVGMRGSVEPGR